jgi:DNA-binding NarL/FixJ family response regulator
VQEAKDGQEALKFLAETRPQLVILDLLMPDSDGFAFLRAADAHRKYPGMKILAMSVVESPDFIQELKRYHVDHYILKSDYTPYTLADLVDKMVGQPAH